jgi:hypothetical protein
MRMLDRWTFATSVALIVGALLACKKKEEAPPPVESATPTPEPSASAATEEPKTDKKEVKRYGDKEQEEKGTVRIKIAMTKVYNEADDSTDFIATLSRGTLVNRKARYGNWMLVDWPSGPGELSPGWVATKSLENTIVTIDPKLVANQDAGVQINDAAVAVVTPDASVTIADGSVAVATADAAVTVTDSGVAVTVPDAGSIKTGGRLKWNIKDVAKAAGK